MHTKRLPNIYLCAVYLNFVFKLICMIYRFFCCHLQYLHFYRCALHQSLQSSGIYCWCSASSCFSNKIFLSLIYALYMLYRYAGWLKNRLSCLEREAKGGNWIQLQFSSSCSRIAASVNKANVQEHQNRTKRGVIALKMLLGSNHVWNHIRVTLCHFQGK